MSTIIIETTEPPRRFEIDLANEPQEFVDEFQKLVLKLEIKSKAVKKNGTKRLSPKLKRASKYIDSIVDRPKSKAALARADEIRKVLERRLGDKRAMLLSQLPSRSCFLFRLKM